MSVPLGASWRFSQFETLTDWPRIDPMPAFRAFRRGAPSLLELDPATASGTLKAAAEACLGAGETVSRADAWHFFERFFRPAVWSGEASDGFLTGYYEPELDASPVQTPRFSTPLYRVPADLMRLPPGVDLPQGLEDAQGFALRDRRGLLAPYPDRGAIEEGWLRGRGLELVWLADPVDAFFVHVQGSARLRLPDGRHMRVGYAAKNGHRFTAIGRLLVNEGELPLERADMEGIRRWLAAHPERAPALMRRNRSFIFFREITDADPQAGPIGGMGVPLTPLGSLAVDRSQHAYGMPILVNAPSLQIDGSPFHRLLVAQDTGSAIVGERRGDLFVGSGDAAGRLAGAIRHPARWTLLVPHEAGKAP